MKYLEVSIFFYVNILLNIFEIEYTIIFHYTHTHIHIIVPMNFTVGSGAIVAQCLCTFVFWFVYRDCMFHSM